MVEQWDAGMAKATPFDFSKFLEIKTSEKDSLGIADGLYNLGKIFAEQGNYNDAVQNYTKALKIYDKFSDSLFISETKAPDGFSLLGDIISQNNEWLAWPPP